MGRASLSLADIDVPPRNRAVLVGTTGSGKTFALRQLLRAHPYAVVLDIKGMIDWPEYQSHTELKKLTAAGEAGVPRLRYAPAWEELKNPATIEAFFEWCYRRGNCAVAVDEVFSVTRDQRIPEYYAAILTRGRELGITLFSATQRPARIPQVILSESECWYVFYLRLPQDRLRIEEVSGIPRDAVAALPKERFYQVNSDMREIRGPLRMSLSDSHDNAAESAA